MMKTIVIIPARMASKRFPNKPMAKIKGIPMIERVWQQAINSNIGKVYVACSEKDVFELIKDKGGNAIMTDPNLPSGTDRVYEGFKQIQNLDELDSIINLQGDMPLISSEDIIKVNDPIQAGYSIGSLATNLNESEEKNINITKVKINWDKGKNIGEALDVFWKFVDLFQNSKLLPEVYFQLANALEFPSIHSDLIASRQYYQRVIKEYPASNFAEQADKRIKYLDQYFFKVR